MFTSKEQEERFISAMERIADSWEKMSEPSSPPKPSPEEVEMRELNAEMQRMSAAMMKEQMSLDHDRRINEWARLRRERKEFERDGIPIREPLEEERTDGKGP